jgi:hypothetical protein
LTLSAHVGAFNAIWADAARERVLQSRLVGPAIDEVAVQPVAGRVAHGVDVFVEVGEGASVEEEFVEDAEELKMATGGEGGRRPKF